MPIKVRDLIKKLQADGWVQTSMEGSHRQFEHPKKPGKVTVAGHLSDDIHPKTLKSISTQAGWD